MNQKMRAVLFNDLKTKKKMFIIKRGRTAIRIKRKYRWCTNELVCVKPYRDKEKPGNHWREILKTDSGWNTNGKDPFILERNWFCSCLSLMGGQKSAIIFLFIGAESKCPIFWLRLPTRFHNSVFGSKMKISEERSGKPSNFYRLSLKAYHFHFFPPG